MRNKNEGGLVTITDPDSDRPLLEVKTLCCSHCGQHWIPAPGSGRTRGFCTRCMGPVCGPSCAECIPMERQIEMLEALYAGRPAPPKIVVPTSFSGE